MKSFFRFISIFVFNFIFTNSTYPQVIDEFIIGSFYDLRMEGNISDDNIKLEEFVEANFNLLSGYNAEYRSYRFDNQKGKVSNLYVLNRVEDINNKYGQTVLKAIVLEKDYWDADVPPAQADLNIYLNLPYHLRKALFGYDVEHEPNFNRLDITLPKLNAIQSFDPDKIAWLIIYGFTASFNEIDYINYVQKVAESDIKVIAFDQYCFMEINDENTDLPKNIENLEPRYFRTHQIVADISKNMNKIFASFALCHEHYYKSDNEEWVRGWFEITEEKLKYSAFAPLIYGAKGIIWFTYDTPCNPKNNNCLTDTLTGWVDKDAILNYYGNKTEKYEQVKNINAQLKAMGPVLIKLNWLETVHGSDINNFDINHTISVWLENNLPTVNDATPVLSDIGIINPSGAPFENEKNIAVGIFNESQGADYLLVFNKDLFGFRSIILEFEKVYNSYEFDYSSSTWVNQEVAITQLEIENIEPAGIKMIKLIEPELDPLCIDYGIYHGIIK